MVKRTYFHVDRTAQAKPGKVFQLCRDYSKLGIYNFPGLIEKGDLIRRLEQLYPKGLSKHGIRYLIETCLIHPHPSTRFKPSEFTFQTPVIELLFEQIRRNEFPDLPSRMQSMFVWSDLSQASSFKRDFIDSPEEEPVVYQVEAESEDAFVGDEKFLRLFGSGIGSYEAAKRYWSGEKTSDPNLEVILPLPVVIGSEIED